MTSATSWISGIHRSRYLAALHGSSYLSPKRAYFPPAHKGEVQVDLSVMSKPAFVYWFDPTDARYIPVGTSPVDNSGIGKFNPTGKNHRGENDWVLLLTTSRTRY